MRLIGTFIGAALGLAVWEISRGNPIGLVCNFPDSKDLHLIRLQAAISAVVFLPGAFFSVFYPQPILSIISLVRHYYLHVSTSADKLPQSTAGLVVGYSYVNLLVAV